MFICRADRDSMVKLMFYSNLKTSDLTSNYPQVSHYSCNKCQITTPFEMGHYSFRMPTICTKTPTSKLSLFIANNCLIYTFRAVIYIRTHLPKYSLKIPSPHHSMAWHPRVRHIWLISLFGNSPLSPTYYMCC